MESPQVPKGVEMDIYSRDDGPGRHSWLRSTLDLFTNPWNNILFISKSPTLTSASWSIKYYE